MRLCTPHDQQLRARFFALGYETPANGEEAGKFHRAGKKDLLNDARAAIITTAASVAPELLMAPVCPICELIKPSWIEEAVQGQIELMRREQ